MRPSGTSTRERRSPLSLWSSVITSTILVDGLSVRRVLNSAAHSSTSIPQSEAQRTLRSWPLLPPSPPPEAHTYTRAGASPLSPIPLPLSQVQPLPLSRPVATPEPVPESQSARARCWVQGRHKGSRTRKEPGLEGVGPGG